jgi:glycosyltransferase involved in cell wall biosynthesis
MISFVIPAHDEAEHIGRAVAAIHEAARAEAEQYEIIVVNDGSTDQTGVIANQQGAMVIDVNHRQIAATRNSGARMAKGDIFFFVDGDTIATRPAIHAAVRALRTGAIGGGCRVRFERPIPHYAAFLERILPVFLHALQMAPGCFLFCTRQAYLDACGFDETLFATEEVNFANRLKQLGRFVILREFVFTSPRKLRTRSALEMIQLAIHFGMAGTKAMRQREGLEFWYGPR